MSRTRFDQMNCGIAQALEQIGDTLLGLLEALDRGGVLPDQVREDMELLLLSGELLVGLGELLLALAGVEPLPEPERAHQAGDAELGQ